MGLDVIIGGVGGDGEDGGDGVGMQIRKITCEGKAELVDLLKFAFCHQQELGIEEDGRYCRMS